MIKLNQNFHKYYLYQSLKINWGKKPSNSVNLKKGNKFEWFPDGKLNLYQNCVSDHLKLFKKKFAIISIDKNNIIKKYTYAELDNLVSKMSEYIFLKKKNKKNFNVMIHASASIESAVLMLACAKIGVHFSVIFEELQRDGIINRIKLFNPHLFFTRFYKDKFNNSFKIKNKKRIKFIYGEDIKDIFLKKKPFNLENRNFKSSTNLFTLFTSGSTGKPKGVTHSTGGYLLYTKMTCGNRFGMNSKSMVLTASDAGWINGHTYSLFGPLIFGATTILLEKPINLINIDLIKKIIKLKTTIIYLPVTLIRLIKSTNPNLRINKKNITAIGSMGEPLAPSIAKWFAKVFKNKNSAVVNTYFQTETGGIICSPKFNTTQKRAPHGSVGDTINNFIKLNNLEQKKLREIKILTPWPGMMKNIINGKKEWDKYWDEKGNFKLFDLATKKKNNIYIHGRNDDVINIRGHRIGSEEIESIILSINEITECCAITLNDKLEGAKIYLFVVSNKKFDNKIEKKIISNFGSFALPKKIFYVKDIPKTRSGKILRRLLRNLVKSPNLKNIGDTSTILNIKSLNKIKNRLVNDK